MNVSEASKGAFEGIFGFIRVAERICKADCMAADESRAGTEIESISSN